jgi:hypothetical protein
MVSPLFSFSLLNEKKKNEKKKFNSFVNVIFFSSSTTCVYKKGQGDEEKKNELFRCSKIFQSLLRFSYLIHYADIQ